MSKNFIIKAKFGSYHIGKHISLLHPEMARAIESPLGEDVNEYYLKKLEYLHHHGQLKKDTFCVEFWATNRQALIVLSYVTSHWRLRTERSYRVHVFVPIYHRRVFTFQNTALSAYIPGMANLARSIHCCPSLFCTLCCEEYVCVCIYIYTHTYLTAYRLYMNYRCYQITLQRNIFTQIGPVRSVDWISSLGRRPGGDWANT